MVQGDKRSPRHLAMELGRWYHFSIPLCFLSAVRFYRASYTNHAGIDHVNGAINVHFLSVVPLQTGNPTERVNPAT